MCVKRGLLPSGKEHRLGVLDNKVLRRIFGPKREELTGGWRKLLNDSFTKYFQGDEIKESKMGGTYMHWEVRDAYKILVTKLKERDYVEDLCIDGRIVLK
jgi:hypothetical protein